jgi:hypothetical protein
MVGLPEQRTLGTARNTVPYYLMNLLIYNNLENHPSSRWRRSTSRSTRLRCRSAPLRPPPSCHIVLPESSARNLSASESVQYGGHSRQFGRARLQDACDLPILQWYHLAPAKA